MLDILHKIIAQFLAAIMALFGLGVGQGSAILPQRPAQTALWAGEELATRAVDWGGAPLARAPALAAQSLAEPTANYGAQLSGRAAAVYAALQMVTPSGFDAASAPGAVRDYVTYTAVLAPADYLVYNRAIGGANGSQPNGGDLAAIGQLLQAQVQAGLEAHGRDYPEIFWIAYGEGGTGFTPDGIYAEDGVTLTITIQAIDLRVRVKSVYAEKVSGTADLLAQTVAALIPPPVLGYSRRETVKAFHDAIIQRVGTRMEYFSDRADEATGPLLQSFGGVDTAPFGSPTGFAKAFKLLCDGAGIPCVVVSGQRNYPNAMPHSWNAVQMEDGQWYAVDVLLDNGYTVADEAIYSEYLLAGSETVDFSFGRQAFSASHSENGYFTPNQYFLFTYPTLSAVRYTDGLELEQLQALLGMALPYPAYCYTEASLQSYTDAIAAGQLLLSDPALEQSRQGDVDNAAAAIALALADLQPLPILRARSGAQATVSFPYHQITLSRAGVAAGALLAEQVESGVAGAQLQVTLAVPGSGYVGTGSTVTVTWNDGACAQAYQVLLLGDTNGDGLINGQDSQSSSGIFTFAEANGQAVLVDVDETLAAGTVVIPTQTPSGAAVTGIGSQAFLFCNNIRELSVPDSVTSLGTRSFYFMDGLELLRIGAGVTELPEEMSFMCGKLRVVELGSAVTSIGTRAFAECPLLEQINLPAGLRTIGREAFMGCRALTDVTLPDGLQRIGVNAFQRCALGEINMPRSLTEIGRGAFANCPNVVLVCGYHSAAHLFALQYGVNYRLVLVLQELRITAQPRKLVYFTGDAFNPQGMEVRAIYDNGGELVLSAANYQIEGFSTDVPGVLHITIRYQTETAALQVRVYDFQYSDIDGESVMVTRYVGLAQDACIPQVIEGKPVTAIGANTFAGRADVRTLAIPPSVTSVQPGAFDGATGLLAFTVAQGSTSFTAPDGVLLYAGGTRLVAYPAGRAAAEYILPAQITNVASHAFVGVAALERVYGGLNAVAWAAGAVQSCPQLRMQVYEFTTAHLYAEADGVPFDLVSAAEDMLITSPLKDRYVVFETLNTAGLELRLRYADGTFYVVPSGYTLGAFNSNTSGTKRITVDFKRFSGGFDVNVAETDTLVYRYTVLEDNSAVLTRYLGTGGDLFVPAMIDGHPVRVLGASLYSGMASITGLTVPGSVTMIESRAFAGCTGLTGVELPESLLHIGDEVFTRCTALLQITLPDSLQTIGAYCFADSTALQSIALPDSVQSVGAYAFSGCASLAQVAVGAGVASLGGYVFHACAALESITVSPANTAYSDADGILFNKAGDVLLRYPAGRTDTSYTVPPQVASIGAGAFAGVRLHTLTVYRTVTSIASTVLNGASDTLLVLCYRNSVAHQFAQQYNILYDFLPDPQPSAITVEALPAKTEYYVGDTQDWSGLSVRVHYPDGTSALLRTVDYTTGGLDTSPLPAEQPSRSCVITITHKGLTAVFTVAVWDVAGGEFTYSVAGNGDLTITGYTGGGGVLRIPAMAKAQGQSSPHPVVAIGTGAGTGGAGVFAGNAGITEVIIPSSVQSIGAKAFRDCANLAKVTLPDALTSLPNECFKDCAALESIRLPAALAQLGEEVFAGSGIKYLPLPGTLQTVAARAFYGMQSLRHLSIPDSVTSIGASAFDQCPALETVFFRQGNPVITSNAFAASGATIALAPVGSAAEGALGGTDATVAAYTVDGDWGYCNWLGSNRIAAYFGADASVTLPETLGGVSITGTMPHAFFGSQTLREATIPERCTGLGAGAFAMCGALEGVTILNGKPAFVFGNAQGDADIFYRCPYVTLAGFENSRAQAYAAQNGVPFTMLFIESFRYVNDYDPFSPEGKTGEGYRMISGFTAAYDTPAEARSVFSPKDGEMLIFTAPDGETELAENARLGSGAQIQLLDAQGRVIDRLIAVYFGDVSGDGRVDGFDALLTDSYLKGMLSQAAFLPAQFLAMDVNRDGVRNGTDFKWMSESGVGLRAISQEAA
ncbi:MAG: leucine-rich repeat protein [Oscillospiraceae bacterium]|jgi:hypothetical protein|nr:leucine-rich repeat protein [Oscillospiraceae bacterium]